MRLYRLVLVLLMASLASACGGEPVSQSPLESLQTYALAIKKKDVKKMRALLSKGSIKMAEDQAKAQNISVDEVILRETLFSPDLKILKFRNEKIDGESASIEVENPSDSFDRIPFIREDGIWKIAKEKYVEEIIKQAEEDEKRVQETINEGKVPVETPQN